MRPGNPKLKSKDPLYIDGIEFYDEREALRYTQLRDQQRYKEIRELVLWPFLTAEINGKKCFELKVSAMYIRRNKQVVEYSRSKVSLGFAVKWKVLQALYYRQYVFKIWPLDYDKKLHQELTRKEHEHRIRTRLFNTRPPGEGFDRSLRRQHVHHHAETKPVESPLEEPSRDGQGGGGAVDSSAIIGTQDDSKGDGGSDKGG